MSKIINQQSWLVMFLALDLSFGLVDYCKNYTFDQAPQHDFMHFSKENSEQEYAVVDSFKSLHCCSHGYRSIEWFKDGQPYPWSTDVSTLIIYPESGNQTIYSQVTAEIDSGGYWCIVRNDTHYLRHDVLLKVSGSMSSVGPPKTTYRPRDQFVSLGRDARFYCEAYVGNINLPDAKSEITWERFGLNGSFIGNDRIEQHIIVREEKQVLGSYLIVKNVEREDFGEYTCKISNTGDQVLRLTAWLKEQEDANDTDSDCYPCRNKIMMFGLIIITAVLSTITFLRFGPQFRLISKRIFYRSHSEDGKEQDVLIVYHERDSDIIANTIVPVLRNRYQYSCNLHPIAKQSALGEQSLGTKANYSRRLMIIMTPFITENEWSCERINSSIEILLNVHLKVICVFFKPLPYIDMKTESGKTLKETLHKVHCIQYCPRKEQHFWATVRLGLPIRKKTSNASRESLEELV